MCWWCTSAASGTVCSKFAAPAPIAAFTLSFIAPPAHPGLPVHGVTLPQGIGRRLLKKALADKDLQMKL
jgi:hypothetical protein